MEKIFDNETCEYLKSSGVSESEIIRIRFEKLKEISIKRLKAIVDLLEKNDFDEIKEYTSFSPAGDCTGCDNHFIDFADIIGVKHIDIIDLCELLENLSMQLKQKTF